MRFEKAEIFKETVNPDALFGEDEKETVRVCDIYVNLTFASVMRYNLNAVDGVKFDALGITKDKRVLKDMLLIFKGKRYRVTHIIPGVRFNQIFLAAVE